MADTAIFCNIHKRSDVDSCHRCDDEHPNPTYIRYALIGVEVDRNWLTDDGEYPDTDGGWVELEKQLRKAIEKRKASRGPFGVLPDIKVWWEEWEGAPEEV